MSHNPLDLYKQRINDGEIQPDPEQEKAIKALQRVYDEIIRESPSPRRGEGRGEGAKGREGAKANWFSRLISPLTQTLSPKGEGLKGVYMYGGVGRGKSMLMDLFYDCIPEGITKERIHFHQFMIRMHDYFHSRREADDFTEGVDGLLPSLAGIIANKSRVLCFDEFHVTDVADAMILGRLFTALFGRGVVIVATSNWEPNRLYEGGLQRERFLPFIDLLQKRMEIVHLNSPTDYRAEALQQEGSYFWPLGDLTTRRADHLFAELTDQAFPGRDYIKVKGRVIKVHKAANGVARFSFAELCEQPHGAEDYIAIAEKYPVVFLENVPVLGYDRRNEAKRLMTLVDALYENKTKLVITADAPPDKLYRGDDHAFEFERTISRLHEMQSAKYLD